MSAEEEKMTAVQNVVDRVQSYQESAPEGTVEKELRQGLEEAEVSLENSQVNALVKAIEADNGPVDASANLE